MQNWAIHGDAIEVLEGQPGSHDPYNGTNSLRSTDNFRRLPWPISSLISGYGPEQNFTSTQNIIRALV